MIYPEVSFIFFSLAVVLFCASVRSGFRNVFILIASALWYFSWGKKGLIIFSEILLFNYIAILLSLKLKDAHRSKFFFALTSINIFIFIFLKLMPILILDGATPYGTSFFMLLILGIIIDKWRENRPFERSETIPLLTMPVFFPLLMAGPIERAKYLVPQFKKPVPSLENLSDGILIFSLGFLKKRYISDYLSDSSLFRQSSGNFLLDGLFQTFLIYIELSSYCEMGRGVAKALGINLTVNFRAFYYSKNPNDFWQRWNITLGTWIRDYVTFPLMFRFGRKVSPNLIIVFSFLLMGLWHGLSLNWVIFGVFNGLVIYLYNVINRKATSQFHGYILSACIWVGLGVFQYQDFFTRITSPFSFIPHYDFSEINIVLITVVLVLFFGFEFVQEKKKDPDFYLKYAPVVKYTATILLIIWFMYALKINAFLENEELPPIYFRI